MGLGKRRLDPLVHSILVYVDNLVLELMLVSIQLLTFGSFYAGKMDDCKEFFRTLYTFIYFLGTYLKPNVSVLFLFVFGEALVLNILYTLWFSLCYISIISLIWSFLQSFLCGTWSITLSTDLLLKFL